jgi:chorismate-pyruvate lyase
MARPAPVADPPELPWTDAVAVAPARRPTGLWSWLTDGGSLTQRLRTRGGSDFALRVLAEQREPLRRADAQRLAVAPDQAALIREVRLDVGGRAAIHAVTVVPEVTAAALPMLAALGARPLGDALFERDDVVRGGFEVACLDAAHPLAARALAAAGEQRSRLWARRSVVSVGRHPLLIHECFLAEWEW